MRHLRWLAMFLPFILTACPAGGGDSLFLLPSGLSTGGAVSTCPAAPWPFEGAYLADLVTEAPGQTGSGFGNALCAVNGIYGGGENRGSTDVYSLQSSAASTKCEPGEKCIVLEWAGRRVKNVAGQSDFVVFENPFNREPGRFIEAVIVEVSGDGISWCGWKPEYTGTDESDVYDPKKYSDLAGIEPVLFDQETWTASAEDIFDQSKAGGDHFDLDDANFGNTETNCDAGTKSDIQTNGFVYVRLTTANSRSDVKYPLPRDSFDRTADIDGVVAREVVTRSE